MHRPIPFRACVAALLGTALLYGCTKPQAAQTTTASGIGISDAAFSAIRHEDRQVGTCVPAAPARVCEKRELGSLVRDLARTSGGKVVAEDDPVINVAGATVSITNQPDFHSWLTHYGVATMARGLQLWSPVFHRNHAQSAAACFTIADEALRSAGDVAAWGIDLGTDSKGRPILTETCEGW